MPKHTNPFQNLIRRIYEQMSESGAIIEESAMIKERNSTAYREVDILIKLRLFETDLKIAVECRGRKDKGDIKWFDGLIGKYHELDIQKVIGVSYTKGVIKHACGHRIHSFWW